MDDLQSRLAAALAGRYTIEGEIGRGGMSIVYQARDLRNDRWVALKVLRPEFASALGPERFLREIKVAAGLTHPHILPLFDSGVAEGLLFYTMPYVEGESLRHRLLRERRLSVADAVTIARDVADALAYAHGQNIVHRDIKPENILLEAGHPVVSDFGIARAISEANTLRVTDTGFAVGTVEYMSPEQAEGKRDLDGRSDIYGLGLVLYEMLTGEHPRLSVDGPVKTVERLRPDAPAGIGAVLTRALATDPAGRFGTAGEFAEALARVGPRPFYERRRVQVVAVPGLALVALGAWWLISGGVTPLDANKVVVFPLAERGRSGIGDQVALMIGSALEHTEPLQWVDGWRLLGPEQRADIAQLTPKIARRVARGGAARFFLQGSIVENGDSASVILWLTDTKTGGDIARASASGSTRVKSLPQLGLEAVTEILPRLLPSGGRIDLSMLSGRRPAAVANWLQGEREYRFSNFGTALGYFRRAVAGDSALAVAALRGAQAASWENVNDDEAAALVAVALKNAKLLPQRQADFARGLSAYFAGQADSAVTWLSHALANSPDWIEAHMTLGETYYHELPNAAGPLDSLAAVEFTAAALDSGFSPPRFHLGEIAIRSGDPKRAAAAVEGFKRAAPQASEKQAQLELMMGCVPDRPRPRDWRSLAHQEPFRLLLVAQAAAIAGALPACAEDGFRAILGDTAIPMNLRWGALLGLQGILAAQNRLRELRALLDSTVASGVEYANWFYLLDVAAGIDVRERAENVMHRYETGAARTAVGPSALSLMGTWRAQIGASAEAESLRAELTRASSKAPDANTARFADALSAWLALQRGDSAAASRLRAVLATAGRDALVWGLSEPLAAHRLLLARYLLEKGKPQEAYAVASVMDHPSALAFLPYLPASLVLRREAGRAMGRTDVVARCDDRLSKLGRVDLLAARP